MWQCHSVTLMHHEIPTIPSCDRVPWLPWPGQRGAPGRSPPPPRTSRPPCWPRPSSPQSLPPTAHCSADSVPVWHSDIVIMWQSDRVIGHYATLQCDIVQCNISATSASSALSLSTMKALVLLVGRQCQPGQSWCASLLGDVDGEGLVQPPGSYCHGHTWTWGCKILVYHLPDL